MLLPGKRKTEKPKGIYIDGIKKNHACCWKSGYIKQDMEIGDLMSDPSQNRIKMKEGKEDSSFLVLFTLKKTILNIF